MSRSPGNAFSRRSFTLPRLCAGLALVLAPLAGCAHSERAGTRIAAAGAGRTAWAIAAPPVAPAESRVRDYDRFEIVGLAWHGRWSSGARR
jgi:hypothetical protein